MTKPMTDERSVKQIVDDLLKLGVPHHAVQPILDFDEIRRLREENERFRKAAHNDGRTIEKLRKLVDAIHKDLKCAMHNMALRRLRALRELDEEEK